MYKIREFEISDLSGNSGIIDCLKTLAPGKYDIKSLTEAFKDRHFSGCSWTFVAVNNIGYILGCVGLTRERKLIHNGAIVLRLEDLCVNPEFRGQGIGQELVKYLIRYASCLNAYKILLNCKPELKTYYERLGFSDDGHNMRLNLGS